MVALITGASRGIGRAIALELARCGYDVGINYANNRDKADETAEECRKLGVSALTLKCDVSNLAECEEMLGRAADLGGVDVLVNNAGITRDGLFMRMSEEQFDSVYSANLKGVYNVTRLAVPAMVKKRYGRIVNISSVAGLYGNAGQVNYSAMKAGVIGFTKALSKELGSRGITVNAVAPGFIDTDMTRSLSDTLKQNAVERIALKRFGTPVEVAKTVAFLVSEGGGYITGQTIEVSGGIEL